MVARAEGSSGCYEPKTRGCFSCATDKPNTMLLRELGADPGFVGKWRERFVNERIAGLTDRPRPNVHRKLQDERVEEVVARTLESARGRDALELANNGEGSRSQSVVGLTNLASVSAEVASVEYLHPQHGSFLYREGARHRGPVHASGRPCLPGSQGALSA